MELVHFRNLACSEAGTIASLVNGRSTQGQKANSGDVTDDTREEVEIKDILVRIESYFEKQTR